MFRYFISINKCTQVLDLIKDKYERVNRDINRLKEECMNEIVGKTVITR
jgi:hypothetical protein